MSRPVLTIGFVTSGIPFDGNTIKEKSLGGSETAMFYMAKSLAALGHRVYAVCPCPRPGVYDGVRYHSFDDWPMIAGSVEFDVLVVSRYYGLMSQNHKAKQLVYWAHDMPPPEEKKSDFIGNMWAVDQFFVMSEFQKGEYVQPSFFPDLERVISVTRNGVDLALIASAIEGVARKRNRIIYSSRPERGLLFLLQFIWPILLEANPELELHLCTYNTDMLMLPDDVKAYHAQIETLKAKSKNVYDAGFLTKEDYYKLLASCSLMLYPTQFPEISCINVMEALACGTPVVTSHAFALPETAASGAELITAPYGTEKYTKEAVFKSLAILRNDLHFGQLQAAGKKWIQSRYDWSQIAREWEANFIEFFQRRVAQNPKAVLRNLVRHDDFVSAEQFALRSGFHEEAALYRTYIDSAIQVRIPTAGNPMEDVVNDTSSNKVPPRIAQVIYFMRDAAKLNGPPKRILDVGCFKGGIAATFGCVFPDAEIVCLDVNPHSLMCAEDRKSKGEPGFAKCTYVLGKADETSLDPKELGQFDFIFCGETMEHIPDTTAFLARLRALLTPTGTVFFTVPSGCWLPIWYHDPETTDPIKRAHVHHFEMSDVIEIFEAQPHFRFIHVPNSEPTYTGELNGWWAIAYQNGGPAFGAVDLDRKLLTTRPWQTISCVMITKNEEPNLMRCLNTVREFVDEIVVVDTGSVDATTSIAARYTDKVLSIEWPEDFSIARNASLAPATGDWVFWIDADELLLGALNMRKYTRTNLFNGFVIRQNHLMLDYHAQPDVPVRLFRNNQGYKFFGVIHEHCEESMDNPIHPSLMLPDVDIAHFGYITEAVRRTKCKDRNIALLLKDRAQNPHRKLGTVLMMRDYINYANWSIEKTRGRFLAPDAVGYLRSCVHVFKSEVTGVDDKAYPLSFPLYQNALAIMGKFGVSVDEAVDHPPFELAFSLAGGLGGLTVPPDTATQPERVWFSTMSEMTAYLDIHRDKLSAALVQHAASLTARRGRSA